MKIFSRRRALWHDKHAFAAHELLEQADWIAKEIQQPYFTDIAKLRHLEVTVLLRAQIHATLASTEGDSHVI